MDIDSIKSYIKNYQSTYSKEQIIAGLRQQGVSDNDINQAYLELNTGVDNKSKKKSSNIFLIVIIIFAVVIFLGFILIAIGALIFSFVDFSSTLPDQLDLSNNLRADASQLVTSSVSNTIVISIKYVGTRAATINSSEIVFESDLGWNCDSSVGITEIENINTNMKGYSSEQEEVQFENGESGKIILKCPEGKLVKGETFEGEVTIPVVNTRTGLEIVSKGRMRSTVQ